MQIGIRKDKAMIFIKFIFLFILLMSVILGCARNETVIDDDRMVVAVSIVPQKAFVEAVAGDLVDVVVMIPPGSNPSNYEPSPMEMEKFSQSSIYFTTGVATEESNILPFTEDLSALRLVSLEKEVAKIYKELYVSPGKRDPHIWLSPKRASIMVDVIARELSLLDPVHEKTYQERARVYMDELALLDRDIKRVMENVMAKKFIVFHPAYSYLADDYGLDMYALEQDGKEATSRRLEEMIDLAKAENIRVIFYQAEISSRQAESFAEEIDGQTMMLAPLAYDYVENYREMIGLMAEVMQ